MMYRKLKRTWSNGYANYMPRFKEVFPELSKLSSEEMADRLIALKMDFYYEEQKPVSFLTRLTLPFALITLLIMFIGFPVNFIATGKWGYELKEKNIIINWFRSLKLA